MSGRTAFALVIASALLSGCDDLHRSHLLSPNGPNPGHLVHMPKQPPPGDPKVEASAMRALKALQKIIDANPSISVRPMLLTVGNPKKSLFHAGTPQTGMQLYITDSLVNACKDEAQLAAVLCTGLGRAVAASAAPALPPGEGPSRIEERLGSDDRGHLGAADGVRMMEAAKAEERKQRATKPNAAALARGYLTTAGYSAEAIKQVAGLLKEADGEDQLREQISPAQPVKLLRPVPKPGPEAAKPEKPEKK